MAKTKKVAGEDIDWYLISIDRLKQIGLVVLLLLMAGGGFWFYVREKGNPRSLADSAIKDARQAMNTLAGGPQFATHKNEFDRAQKKLDEANSLFNTGKFPEAQGAAVESQTISRGAVSGGSDKENAQFLTVEGDVQFQKSETSDWRRAETRTPLFNGDWVKTGDSASAELIFSNGSLYTIGANALLEIYSSTNPATSKKMNTVQMQVGSVEVATTDDASTVRTPGSQVVIDSESTTQVGVDKNKATAVISMKGSASVAPPSGGDARKLNSGEKVSATAEGVLSAVKKLTAPPGLTSPPEGQVFTANSKVDFSWDPVPGSNGYVLEVSRSRLFSSLEINSKREKTTASARVTSEGAFYWRVASLGPDGEPGPFSPFRRFRASGGGDTSAAGGTPVTESPAPTLQLKKPYHIGGIYYLVEGTTQPGTTVFINNEEVEVESNGHFKKLVGFEKLGPNDVIVKAVNAAGKQTIESATVIVEQD